VRDIAPSIAQYLQTVRTALEVELAMDPWNFTFILPSGPRETRTLLSERWRCGTLSFALGQWRWCGFPH
jgi:hypothetical protein